MVATANLHYRAVQEFEDGSSSLLACLYDSHPGLFRRIHGKYEAQGLPCRERYAIDGLLRDAWGFVYFLAGLPLRDLPRDREPQYRAVRAGTQFLIARLENFNPWLTDPAVYVEELAEAIDMIGCGHMHPGDFQIASIEEVLTGLNVWLERAKSNVANAPKPWTLDAINRCKNLLVEFAAGQDVFNGAGTNDVKLEIERYLAYLKGELLPRSNGSAAIGERLYAYLQNLAASGRHNWPDSEIASLDQQFHSGAIDFAGLKQGLAVCLDEDAADANRMALSMSRYPLAWSFQADPQGDPNEVVDELALALRLLNSGSILRETPTCAAAIP